MISRGFEATGTGQLAGLIPNLQKEVGGQLNAALGQKSAPGGSSARR